MTTPATDIIGLPAEELCGVSNPRLLNKYRGDGVFPVGVLLSDDPGGEPWNKAPSGN